MVIVDTHVHSSPYWYEPIEVLMFQMDRNKVDKATLVQHQGQTDNSYIIECAHRFPGRFSPVIFIDTEQTDASDVLKKRVKEGAECLRLRPTTRSKGKDPLAIWRTCAELKIPVTCVGKEDDFASDEFNKLISALPNVSIIIEHLGKPGRDEPPPYNTFQKILSLAKYRNTYIKVPGLGEISHKMPHHLPLPFESIPPYIKMAYEAFGPSRMMWGSNYPPSSGLEGYTGTLRYLGEHLAAFCNEQDKQWIFGKTALSLFKFQ